MSTATSIEWTRGDDGTAGATWNPVVGCTRVSAGCDHCYAVKQSYRLEKMRQQRYIGLTVLNGKGERHFNGVVRTIEHALTIPLRWKKPKRIFVNSMSDLFHKDVPFNFIDKVFAVMALCPQHQFQVLTKRPERMAEYTSTRTRQGGVTFLDVAPFGEMTDEQCDRLRRGLESPLPNVWLGASVENRAALERICKLAECPAAVHFISFEPLLEDLGSIRGYLEQHIEWAIVGGESGPGARPMDLKWARSLVKQCADAGVACFVKQLGAKPEVYWCASGAECTHPDCGNKFEPLKDKKGGDPSEWPEDLRVREFPVRGGEPR